MHAAVWSQPITSHNFTRSHSQVVTPSTPAGKIVLGVGIALTLAGGLLAVLGITGYFVRGDNKFFLGFGTPTGACTLFAGLTGTRAVSYYRKNRLYTIIFIVLSLLTFGSSTCMVVLGSLVLRRPVLLLLTRVIGVAETGLATLVAIVAAMGCVVAIHSYKELINPSLVHSYSDTGSRCRETLHVAESCLSENSFTFGPENDLSHM